MDTYYGATFTVTLGELVSSGYNIWLDTWPIYEESYRAELKKKIERHYWRSEIGMETADDFRDWLDTTLCEIMPYYNQRYESCLLNIEDDSGSPLFSGKTVSDIVRELKTQRTNVVDGHTVNGVTTQSKNQANVKDTSSHSSNGWNSSNNTDKTTESGSDSTEHTGTDGTVESASESRDITSTRTDDLHSKSTNGKVTKRYDVPITGSSDGFSDTYITNGQADSGNNGTDNTGSQTTHEQASADGNKRDSNSTTTHDTADTTNYGHVSQSEGTIESKNGDTETASSSSDSTGQSDTTSNTDVKNDVTTNDNGTDNEHTTNTTTTTMEPLFELLMKYRESFINVDMEVVNDPEVAMCFMQIH